MACACKYAGTAARGGCNVFHDAYAAVLLDSVVARWMPRDFDRNNNAAFTPPPRTMLVALVALGVCV